MELTDNERIRKLHRELLVRYIDFHKIDRWSVAYEKEISESFSILLDYLEREISLQERG